MTPFNNPALLLFLMATLPEYGLQWPVGRRPAAACLSRHLGSAAAAHPQLRPGKVTLAFNATQLPAGLL